MRFLALIFSFATILVSGVSSARNPSSANCVAFAEAAKHVGTTQCIRGTVLRVEDGRDGMKFLNFCNDHQTCPFTVVVFPADLKKMGDIHQLEGRQVEVKGTVQDHDGRTEIVLRRSQQLGESAFQLFPSVPTDYDVERRGHAHTIGALATTRPADTFVPRQTMPSFARACGSWSAAVCT
jgi:DNA/RNA endonuclease YhcR with UshA esterase domain